MLWKNNIGLYSTHIFVKLINIVKLTINYSFIYLFLKNKHMSVEIHVEPVV